MRKIFYLLALLIFGTLVFNTPSLEAALLNEQFDLQHLKGKKLGYYPGSFDPIHLGHQHVIDTALEKKYVDYVLIYPVPGGDIYKNRSDLFYRQQMIASIYKDNPKVLLTYWSPKELQERFNELATEVDVVGIIGSDVITERLMGPDKEFAEKYQKILMRGVPLSEKHYEDTVGALMALKANSFLVTLRGNIDLSFLNGHIYDRTIRAFIESGEQSSTRVRKAIAEGQSIDTLVAPTVQTIIQKEKLYEYSLK